VAIIVLAFIATLLIPEVPLRQTVHVKAGKGSQTGQENGAGDLD